MFRSPTVIEAIKKQTNYTFSYDVELETILKEKKVTINVTRQSIVQILPVLFDTTDIAYKVVDDNILLSKKNLDHKTQIAIKHFANGQRKGHRQRKQSPIDWRERSFAKQPALPRCNFRRQWYVLIQSAPRLAKS